VLLFDGDEAGQRAMERALAILLPEGLRVRAAALPTGDDPDSLLLRDGADALRAVVDSAAPALEAVIRRAAARGHATPWEKSDAVGQVAPLLALVADPVERGEHERQLALAIGVAADEVRVLVRRQSAERRGVAAEREDAAPIAVRSVAGGDPNGRERRWAEDILRQWLDHPVLAREVEAEQLAGLFPHPPFDRLLPAVAELCDGEHDVDVEALATRLDDESAAALRAIAMTDAEPHELARARELQVQTLGRLRQRRLREESREHTRRFLAGEINADALLAGKQRGLRGLDPFQLSHPGSGHSGAAS